MKRSRTALALLLLALPVLLVDLASRPASRGASDAADVPPITRSVEPPVIDEERPNIVIFVTDDQRIGSMNVMPRTREWFQKAGTRFSNAYATTPACCPSRASIFTGRYAHNHRVLNNGDRATTNLDHDGTIQRYLHDAGYRTGIFGKFLNGWDLRRDPPHFDEWVIFRKGYGSAEYNVWGVPRQVRTYSTDFIRDRAARFVRDAAKLDQPWYLYVAPIAPHPPATPAARHADAPIPPFEGNPAVFEEDRSDKPPFVQEVSADPAAGVDLHARQSRALMAVDEMVDGVMREVRAAGELDNTLAFFLSDNGLLYGEHGWGTKRVPYTHSIKVPMFARWPGRFLEQGLDPRMVANIDIAPTVLEAAGVPAAGGPMDGRSLLDRTWVREYLLLEHWAYRMPNWASLRGPGFQYIEYYDGGAQDLVFREYYDLQSDPWQLTNLLGDGDPGTDPSTVPALSRVLSAARRCSGLPACP